MSRSIKAKIRETKTSQELARLLRQTLEKSASKNIGNLKQALDTLKAEDYESAAQIIKIVIANLKQQELSYKAFADELDRQVDGQNVPFK